LQDWVFRLGVRPSKLKILTVNNLGNLSLIISINLIKSVVNELWIVDFLILDSTIFAFSQTFRLHIVLMH
jgi:hypothetical protein